MNQSTFTKSFDACVGHAAAQKKTFKDVTYEIGEGVGNTFYYKLKDKIGRTWSDGGFSLASYADIEAQKVIAGLLKQGDV